MPRRPRRLGIDSEFKTGVSVEGNGSVLRDDPGDGVCVFGGDPLGSVHSGQFPTFSVWVLGKFSALDLQFTLDQLVLGTNRDEFPSGHGEGARKEAGHTGQAHRRRRRTGTGHAEDQRHIGDQPVACSKNRGTGRPPLDVAVTCVVVHIPAGHPGSEGAKREETIVGATRVHRIVFPTPKSVSRHRRQKKRAPPIGIVYSLGINSGQGPNDGLVAQNAGDLTSAGVMRSELQWVQ